MPDVSGMKSDRDGCDEGRVSSGPRGGEESRPDRKSAGVRSEDDENWRVKRKQTVG